MNDLAKEFEAMREKMTTRVAYEMNGKQWFAYTDGDEITAIIAEKSKGKIEVFVCGVGWVPKVQTEMN